jgi:hypothetical protein
LTDRNGQKLTGTKRYTPTFRQPMHRVKASARGFRSMTAYDAATGLALGAFSVLVESEPKL